MTMNDSHEEISSSSTTTITVEQEKHIEDLRRKYQRDINCLLDSDRNVRKRAIIKLNRKFIDNNDDDVLMKDKLIMEFFFVNYLSKPLLTLINDTLEKCREVTCNVLIEYIKNILSDNAVLQLSSKIFPLVATRIGVFPFAEPTEEIRLLLCELCSSILKKPSIHIIFKNSEISTSVSMILSKALTDVFPDVKKECCKLLSLCVLASPESLRRHLIEILKPLIANLSHQHQKVRKMTLQGIGKLLLCGADNVESIIRDTVLPALGKLIYDRHPSVRLELVKVLSGWLQAYTYEDSDIHLFKSVEVDILILFMMGFGDEESPEVQSKTESELLNIGECWWKHQRHSQTRDQTIISSDDIITQHEATAEMIQALLIHIMPRLLNSLSHWTEKARLKSLLLLGKMIPFAGNAIISYSLELVRSLVVIVSDDEIIIRTAALSCCQILGQSVETRSILEILLPQLRGDHASVSDTIHHPVRYLLFLIAFLDGAGKIQQNSDNNDNNQSDIKWIDDVIYSIAHENVLINDIAVAKALVQICNTLVIAYPSAFRESHNRFHIIRVLLYVIGISESNEEITSLARENFNSLSEINGRSNHEQLIELHFDELISIITPTVKGGGQLWHKNGSEIILFKTLIRYMKNTVLDNFEKVLPLFVQHLQIPDTMTESHDVYDQEVRTCLLDLLQTLYFDERDDDKLSVSNAFMEMIILPNIQLGYDKANAQIRLSTLSCLFALLQRNRISVENLYTLCPHLLPKLKLFLGDKNVSIRRLTCLSLWIIFGLLPGAFDYAAVHDFYQDLLAKLDDSNNEVRKAGCKVISTFLKCTDKVNIAGATLTYVVEQLLMVLDDSGKDIQKEAFDALKVAIDLNPKEVGEEISKAHTARRSPEHCTALLNYAASIINASSS